MTRSNFFQKDDNTVLTGQIVQTCVIRDLSGMGFDHIGKQGQDIIKSGILVMNQTRTNTYIICFQLLRSLLITILKWWGNVTWYSKLYMPSPSVTYALLFSSIDQCPMDLQYIVVCIERYLNFWLITNFLSYDVNFGHFQDGWLTRLLKRSLCLEILLWTS